ncbi:MAG: aminopeptidase N [Pseudomonadota bacterium]|nr:aminopeptidase N [Pseudomonadota bacterium]
MADIKRTAMKRADYTPYPFELGEVELAFDLKEMGTVVRAKVFVVNTNAESGTDMVLNAEEMEIDQILIDGNTVTDYVFDTENHLLTLKNVPAKFTLETTVKINPAENKTGSGLYMDGEGGNRTFITQCESEGFRRITPWPDRPDVMTTFKVELNADAAQFPTVLSNGNRIAGDTTGGHAVWHDPHKKPSYLFALVACAFDVMEDSFTTMSGRDVKLEIWMPTETLPRVRHAMDSLIRSFKWDEEAYGREYDLDLFMIVGTDTFNAGAMENKGLNIFNNSLLVGDKDTADDNRLKYIEAVIGHEYFHNWTGDRVTCKSWFELTLKEGLTVFRDQQFTSHLHSAPLERIVNAAAMKARQFPEASGPMAHPIRPEVVESMDNFYTVTVYEKGAEVIGMYHTLLGPEGYRKGTDLYFDRHDGQAVTCDDFRAAMADANDADFRQFALWYSQAGTPTVTAQTQYDADAKTFTVTLTQSVPATPANTGTEAMHIPVRLGLVGPDGKDIPMKVQTNSTKDGWPLFDAEKELVNLMDESVMLVFEDVAEEPVLSLNRNFGAPIYAEAGLSLEQKMFLAQHDSDGYNRYEMVQSLLMDHLKGWVDGNRTVPDSAIMRMINQVLADDGIDDAVKAEMIKLPAISELMEKYDVIPLDRIHEAYDYLKFIIASRCQSALMEHYTRLNVPEKWAFDGAQAGRRALKNQCLSHLSDLMDRFVIDMDTNKPMEDYVTDMAQAQFEQATNYTDKVGALRTLVHAGVDAEIECKAFEGQFRSNPQVMDAFFSMHATVPSEDALETVKALENHSAFDGENPNKIRSLWGAFGGNTRAFHKADGSGYTYFADKVMYVDGFNPGVAGRIVAPFLKWNKMDTARAALMKAEIERMLAREGVSKNLKEVLGKALEQEQKAA